MYSYNTIYNYNNNYYYINILIAPHQIIPNHIETHHLTQYYAIFCIIMCILKHTYLYFERKPFNNCFYPGCKSKNKL